MLYFVVKVFGIVARVVEHVAIEVSSDNTFLETSERHSPLVKKTCAGQVVSVVGRPRKKASCHDH